MLNLLLSIAFANSSSFTCEVIRDLSCKNCRAPIQVNCEQGAYLGFISDSVKPQSYTLAISNTQSGTESLIELPNKNKSLKTLTQPLEKDKDVIQALASKKIQIGSQNKVDLIQVKLKSDIFLYSRNDGLEKVNKPAELMNRVQRSVASEGPAVGAGGVGRAQQKTGK